MHVLNHCVMIGSYWVVFLKVLLNGHGLLEETQVSEGKIVSNKAQATVDDFRDQVRDDIELNLSHFFLLSLFF
jgi:hypothetical protein